MVRLIFLGLPGRSLPSVPGTTTAGAAAVKKPVQGREESKGESRSGQKESTKVSSKATVPTKPPPAVADGTSGVAPVPREWVRLLLSACRGGGGDGGGGGGESLGSNLAAAVDALTKIAMQSTEEEDEEEGEEGQEDEEGEEEEEEGQARADVPVKEEEVRERGGRRGAT